ncbi:MULTISPECIES: hypothetical protein [unclassified Paenibacillus]|uniref:hypothetical protein n=1 Tax=unclassified Paenibacillus TaxID=185978 RepID=UPI00339AD12D
MAQAIKNRKTPLNGSGTIVSRYHPGYRRPLCTKCYMRKLRTQHLINGRAIALFSLVTGASRRVQPALRNELSLLDKHI